MSDQNRLPKFRDKKFRDGYLQTSVCGGIAYQIHALREKTGLTQEAFAEKIDKKQSTVSRLENSEYGKVTVQTLLDVACSLDVALLVRFVSYPEFLEKAAQFSLAELQPMTIFESIEQQHRKAATTIATSASEAASANTVQTQVTTFAVRASTGLDTSIWTRSARSPPILEYGLATP